MTILITGATGTVSTTLLQLLASRPHTGLRALVRDRRRAPVVPGVEVVLGDLDHPASLTEAFSGVSVLWLLTAAGPLAPHQSSNAVWAARHASVTHVVRLSAIGAAHDAPTRNGRLHALSDAELAASGIPYTVLKPSAFMQNLFGPFNNGTLYHNWAQGRVGFIDARDIAEFAAQIIADPRPHASRNYTITGPERLSMTEAATRLSQGVGTPIGAQEVPDHAVVDGMRRAGLPDWVADVVGREYGAAYAAGWGDLVTDDFRRVVGRNPRTLADFGRDHASAFGGVPIAA